VGFVDPAGGRRCKAVVFRRRDGGVRLVCKQRETRNDAVVPYIPPPPLRRRRRRRRCRR
jgi:hypothetical protein